MINKKIPKENYIKYGLIILVSLLSCFTLYTIYNNNIKYQSDISLLRNKVKEIDVKDIDNYISEIETVFLYFGVVNDTSSEKIEKEMINELDIEKSEIIYVNITSLKNKKDYLKKFSEKYSSNKKITSYPAFVYIKDQVIVDVIEKDDRDIVINDVINFINTNEIKGEKNA